MPKYFPSKRKRPSGIRRCRAKVAATVMPVSLNEPVGFIP